MNPRWFTFSGWPLLTAGSLVIGTLSLVAGETGPLKAGTRAVTNAPTQPSAASVGAKYPYYADTPEEMIPYRNIEPYYRYFTTRQPFLGPGRDYPDPPDLKSLKVGLLSPPNYGSEGGRGGRTRQGVELAFEEANAARKPGALPFEIIYRSEEHTSELQSQR